DRSKNSETTNKLKIDIDYKNIIYSDQKTVNVILKAPEPDKEAIIKDFKIKISVKQTGEVENESSKVKFYEYHDDGSSNATNLKAGNSKNENISYFFNTKNKQTLANNEELKAEFEFVPISNEVENIILIVELIDTNNNKVIKSLN